MQWHPLEANVHSVPNVRAESGGGGKRNPRVIRSIMVAAMSAFGAVPTDAHAADSSWILNQDGAWGVPLHWSNGIPNAINDDASFGGAITAPVTVTQNLGEVILGGIAFNSAHAYTITGNTLTMNIGAGSIPITVQQGTHTIGSALALNDPLTVTTSAGSTLTLGSVISGTGGLTKNGAGTLTLAGTTSNSYNGNTTVNQGTLQLARTAAIGVPNGTLTIGDGTTAGAPDAFVVLAQGGAFASGLSIAVRSNGQLDGGNLFQVIQSPLTMTGGSIVNANLRILTHDVVTHAAATSATISGTVGLDFFGQSRRFDVADGTAANDLVVTAPITGSGGFVKAGPGTMVLGGAAGNTHTGVTAVQGGTLVLDKTAGSPIVAALEVGNGIPGFIGSGGILRLARPSQIPDSLAVTLNAGGLLTLNGHNETIGSVTFNGGVLDTGGATVTLGGNITTYAGAVGSSIGGPVVFAAPAEAVILVEDGTAAVDLTLNGAIAAAASLRKTGDGTLAFSGNASNTYTGLTTVAAGTLLLNKAVGATAIAGSLVVGDDASVPAVVRLAGSSHAIADAATVAIKSSGRLDLNNRAEVLGPVELTGGEISTGPGGFLILGADVTTVADDVAARLTGTGTVDLIGGPRTFTVADGAAAVDLDIEPAIVSGSLVKAGAGMMRISGAGTYTGATTVSAGKLLMEQSLRTSSSITVALDATFVLVPGGNKVIETGVVTADGRLDLGDNKMVTTTPIGSWNGSGYTGVHGMVASGRAGGAWSGNGIVTTDTRAVNSSDYATLGVATADELGRVGHTFAGVTLQSGDTLVMLTWGGDANLDGIINIDDYGRIDANVASSGSVFGWYNGDFNYDGAINIDDYGIIDGNISEQGAAFTTGGGVMELVAVPEPAGALAAVVAAASLTRGRFRKRPNR